MEPQDRENEWLAPGRVIAIAAATAAAVGGATVALLQRREEPESPPPAGAAALLADPRIRAIAETAKGAMADPRVRSLAESARMAAGDPRLATILEQARERLELEDRDMVRQDLARRVSEAMESVRLDGSPRARLARERAREAAERLHMEGAARSADLGTRMQHEVAPAARALAREALAEADEILAAARERAAELSETARETYLPRVGAGTAAATGVAAEAISDAARTVGERLSEMREQGQLPAPKEVTQRLTRSGGTALQRAGAKTGYVLSETIMIAFWGSVVGGVIYFGLLNEEQRERVRRALNTASEQLQNVMAVLRGNHT